ncbi:hypothetical protein TI39_contig1085g00003 [Zymoseptoria brevis]|uniref:Uncharacterized protein n=1 Tax=Zymoseptoria brevis TaxID=1047168 RepID=A0A0F4GE74_9PEZI|nr:hypothetical protein TI39_contig1085g00003 [Zymoseptoria brevis]
MTVHPAVAAARLRNVMLLADEGLRVGEKAGDLLEELLAAFAEIPASPLMPTMPQDVGDAIVNVMVEYAEASAKVTIEQYGDCPAATASYKDHHAAYGQPTQSAKQIANVPHLVSIGLYNCPLVDFASFAQRSTTNPVHYNLRQLEHLKIRIDFTLCEPPLQK